MKVTKKELLTLEYNKYNSEDYYIENDEENILDYDNYWSKEELTLTIDSLDDLIESYFILTGSSGTWQGNREIIPGYVTSVQEVLDRMDVDSISIYYDPKELAIVVKGTHHDGINMYYLRKPEWYTKTELINICIDLNDCDKEYFKDDIKDIYDLNIYKAYKNMFIEYLQEHLLVDYT
jgi:hypothetical protein